MRSYSFRLRLILAYAGLIVLGFGALALIAGQQLSSAARDDYEIQLANQVVLVARGMAASVREYQLGVLSRDDLETLKADYEQRTDSTLTLYIIDAGPDSFQPRDSRDRQSPNGEQNWVLPTDLLAYPEFQAASRNAISIQQRDNSEGTSTLYTAAPISDGAHFLGYVQLSQPASQLQRALYKRWIALGLGVLAMTALALLASAWLSTSLIRPLDKLRNSALRLSQGDLSHRIARPGSDEIGEVAEAFNQMADRVEAMLNEQRAFASNTSHEFRTPLTTMRLRTEALRYDPSLSPADRAQYVAEIDDELVRLGSLLEDLILLSRFDAGRAELGKDRIDAERFVRSLTQSFAAQAAEKGITLHTETVLDRPVQLQASLNHLTILFRNLLDNAIKYTPEGGMVRWGVRADAGQAVFTVQDTGVGIAPEHLPHLFERFYRADKARSRSVQGTGLGLALAKTIVEAYHGRITVTSEGAGGTTVTVFWPLPQTAPDEGAVVAV